MTRLALLTTHPVQYVAPLCRRLAQEDGWSFKAYFASRLGLGTFYDPLYARSITWGLDLLDGYEHDFLPTLSDPSRLGWLAPFAYGLTQHLKRDRIEALWVHGYTRPHHVLAMIQAKRMGLHVLVRDEAHHLGPPKPWARRMAKRALIAALDPVVDAWLAIGRGNAAMWRDHGIDEAKIGWMPYAVDNAYFGQTPPRPAPSATLGIPDHACVVLYAGRMSPEKRVDDLVTAYRGLGPTLRAKAHLVLAGAGPGLEALRHTTFGEGHIHWLGFQDQAQLRAWYARADILVLPSSYEPWGLVVNEAMNQGCAVIVSDRVGAGLDLVRDGENGFVIPAARSDILGERLARLIADNDLRVRMGQRSRDMIQDFDFKADVCGLRAALDRLKLGAGR